MINRRFVTSHPAHLIALGFGSGLSQFAPGTAGTLWAWVSFLVMQLFLSTTQLACVIVVATFVGWWACTKTAAHLIDKDPGVIVIDEIVAFWLILLFWMPAGFWAQFTAFVIFRILDAAKPGPVGWADRYFHGWGWRGGWGIMFDDLVAAFCTLLILSLWQATR